jgi:hypothetical protein
MKFRNIIIATATVLLGVAAFFVGKKIKKSEWLQSLKKGH